MEFKIGGQDRRTSNKKDLGFRWKYTDLQKDTETKDKHQRSRQTTH